MFPELAFHIRAVTRLIYFVTEEEDRFLTQLNTAMREKAAHVKVYNAAFGLVPLSGLITDWGTKTHTTDNATLSIHDALISIYKDLTPKERKFYVITDPDRWLRDVHIQRRILNILHQVHNNVDSVKILICVGNQRYVPEKLARYTEVVQDTGLSNDEILEVVEGTCTPLKMDVPENSGTLLKGLTSFEIQSALIQTYKKTQGYADPKLLNEYRFKQLKKTDLVQHIDTSRYTFDQIGGAKRFKTWANKTAVAWKPEGVAFGLEPPKGVLVVGVWGTGKSLSIKALGNAWNLPVIQFDLGRLRQSGVGDSENNTYRALKIIESVAPCVTGETEITLSDGSIKSIEKLWREGSKELKVRCWNERYLKVENTRVQGITRRQAEAFCISAANGFKLSTTANHLHYVMRGGMPEWVRTDELLQGDMLAVTTNCYEGNFDCTCFHPKGMRVYKLPNGNFEFRRGGGGWTDTIVSKLPKMWTPELGWLLGILEGDGHLNDRGLISLINTSTVLLDVFEKSMANLFELYPVRYETTCDPNNPPNLPSFNENSVFNPCWSSLVQNKLVKEFFLAAKNNILTAPQSVRAAFLAGWIDADGFVSSEKVGITVAGPKLQYEKRQLVRHLIQSLGVVPSKFNTNACEITGPRAVKLASILEKYLIAKKLKAQIVTSSDIGFDRGMGFACGQVLLEARKQSGLLWSQIKPLSSGTIWAYEKGKVNVSERHLLNYINKFGKQATELKDLYNAECRWIKISSIKNIGVKDVFDLLCEGEDTHSFIANGLITHNCLIFCDEAEKSLSGGQSSAHTDAGTTSRMVGIISTWLQETTAPVCMAMTANSLKTLPIEMINRADERWFFDLPSLEDRIDILKIHLQQRNQDPSKFNLVQLAESAKSMVGREIEQCLKAAMVESFEQKKPGLDENILLTVLEHKPRIVRTMVDEITEILSWVGFDPVIDDGVRARFAADPHSQDRKFSIG